MPLNETFTGIIEKLTQRIDELKAQIGDVDTRSTMAYNQSVSLADAIAKMKQELAAQKEQVNENQKPSRPRGQTSLDYFSSLKDQPKAEIM